MLRNHNFNCSVPEFSSEDNRALNLSIVQVAIDFIGKTVSFDLIRNADFSADLIASLLHSMNPFSFIVTSWEERPGLSEGGYLLQGVSLGNHILTLDGRRGGPQKHEITLNFRRYSIGHMLPDTEERPVEANSPAPEPEETVADESRRTGSRVLRVDR